MPYSPTTWQDRVVQYPQRYGKTGETSTEVTLTASPGTVTQAGTPINATNMNKIEAGIAAALPRDGSAAMTGQLQVIGGSASVPGISWSNTQTGFYFPGNSHVVLVSAGVDALYVDNNRRVGIGVYPTLAQLSVKYRSSDSGQQNLLSLYNSVNSPFMITTLNNTSIEPGWLIQTSMNSKIVIQSSEYQTTFETNGAILAGVNGSQTIPVLSRTGDTNTGIYFAAADKLAFTEGGKGITLDELKMMASMGGML